jgi:hypothetical protein
MYLDSQTFRFRKPWIFRDLEIAVVLGHYLRTEKRIRRGLKREMRDKVGSTAD